MAKIVWVEDQFHWLDKLTPVIAGTDFGDGVSPNEVLTFSFAEAACQTLRTMAVPPDLVLLDANMNGDDNAGFMVSRLLQKKWPQVPIIYFSEHSGTGIEQTALEKLETRDFIAKHQENIEQILCWRMKAVFRQAQLRHSANGAIDLSHQENMLQSGLLTFDLASWEAYWAGDKLMNPKNPLRPLPPTPRKILRFLLERTPRPLSTQQAADYLEVDHFNYASYRQHIRTLRQSFDVVFQQQGLGSFVDLCRTGQGIVAFGDEAYCWKPVD